MTYLEPTPEQIQALLEGPEGPVVMLNLLRFKRNEAGEKIGLESYMKYAEAVAPLLEKAGGAPVWGGRGEQVVIGEDSDRWDTVVLASYPSRSAFLGMAGSPEYQAINHLRTEALEEMRLIVCNPNEVF